MPPLDGAGARLAGTPLEPVWRSNAKFVVVGAGALGSEVFRSLALLRPASILVIDPDSVAPTDLAKSWLFTDASVGTHKARHLASLASTHVPETDVRALACEFADTGWQELQDASVVFSCVDSDLARLEIALGCRRLGLPVCDAGLAAEGASAGRVTWFPASGACFGCKLRPQRLRELLLFAQADVRTCTLAATGGFHMTPALASLIASMQVDFGLRSWLAARELSESLEIALAPEPFIQRFENPISAACPLHECRSETHIAATPGRAFADLLPSAEFYFALDWPRCTLARCAHCGYEWQPFVRCAHLRRTGVCPQCHARAVIELESIREITRDSQWAGFTPEQLGLPANHLLRMRTVEHGALAGETT